MEQNHYSPVSVPYPPPPQKKALQIIFFMYCRFYLFCLLFTVYLLLFRKQPTIEILAYFRELLVSEGTRWALKLGAVHLIFPPNAVSEPTPIVVYRWKSSVCSPPLQEHEAIVSNVIELSSRDGQRLKFSAMVTLSLSHSAPDLRGYEVVIKRQINKKTNEWEDVSGTQDLRCRQGIVSPYSRFMATIDNRFADAVSLSGRRCTSSVLLKGVLCFFLR